MAIVEPCTRMLRVPNVHTYPWHLLLHGKPKLVSPESLFALPFLDNLLVLFTLESVSLSLLMKWHGSLKGFLARA